MNKCLMEFRRELYFVVEFRFDDGFFNLIRNMLLLMLRFSKV